jgi:nicotinamidase-related amidase
MDMDALLIVDFQNDFTPGGALPVPGGDEIGPALNAIADRFDLVVATRDWHPPDHGSFAGVEVDPAGGRASTRRGSGRRTASRARPGPTCTPRSTARRSM